MTDWKEPIRPSVCLSSTEQMLAAPHLLRLQDATLRAALFSYKEMPDDLAQMYVELAQTQGHRTALWVLGECLEFQRSAYLPEQEEAQA